MISALETNTQSRPQNISFTPVEARQNTNNSNISNLSIGIISNPSYHQQHQAGNIQTELNTNNNVAQHNNLFLFNQLHSLASNQSSDGILNNLFMNRQPGAQQSFLESSTQRRASFPTNELVFDTQFRVPRLNILDRNLEVNKCARFKKYIFCVKVTIFYF